MARILLKNSVRRLARFSTLASSAIRLALYPEERYYFAADSLMRHCTLESSNVIAFSFPPDRNFWDAIFSVRASTRSMILDLDTHNGSSISRNSNVLILLYMTKYFEEISISYRIFERSAEADVN